MKTLTTCFAAALISLSASVQAATINEREAAQRTSIRNGYADGSLTTNEARHLRNQQLKLERKEQRYRADGVLTRRERASLQSSLDANRARIYRQRHDAQGVEL